MNDRLKRDAESAISDLISEIENLEAKCGVCEDEISSLNRKISSLEDDVANLQDEIDKHDSLPTEFETKETLINNNYNLY